MGAPGRTAAIALGLALAAALAPATARAIVSDAHLIDGPSADLEGEPDAAMAEDGTGGVVYLRRVNGHEHVFAVPFEDGRWGASMRVDAGQAFDSSWPRIAAGDGGRLLVTWVQDFGVQTDRMFSATMDPGAGGFQAPVPVDFDIGKATSTFPDLAMSRGGQAYLVYNVVTDTSTANPPGYLGIDVRLARYSNRLWSAVGPRIDRNGGLPMRQPTAAIAPRVGIDVQGQAVVAWLEPDDEFVDRVWARRVFGGQTGIPLQVSPSLWEDRPLRGSVGSFSLDVSGFGQATVAFTQAPGQNGALDAVRVMVNGMPDVFTEGASEFGDPHLIDESARPSVASPAVGVDPTGLFNVAFGSGSATLLSTGDDFSLVRRRADRRGGQHRAAGAAGRRRRERRRGRRLARAALDRRDGDDPGATRRRGLGVDIPDRPAAVARSDRPRSVARAWATPSSPGHRGPGPRARSPPRWSTPPPIRSSSSCPTAGAASARCRSPGIRRRTRSATSPTRSASTTSRSSTGSRASARSSVGGRSRTASTGSRSSRSTAAARRPEALSDG